MVYQVGNCRVYILCSMSDAEANEWQVQMGTELLSMSLKQYGGGGRVHIQIPRKPNASDRQVKAEEMSLKADGIVLVWTLQVDQGGG